jgi:hypothetical protein
MRRGFDPKFEVLRPPLPLFTLREYKAGRIVQRCEHVGGMPLIRSYLFRRLPVTLLCPQSHTVDRE